MKLINTFLKCLEVSNIKYVHWKSNTNIKLALTGIDDLDILVDPNCEQEISLIFKELDIIRAFSDKDKWQKGIFHFIGLDIETQKLVHIHLHYKLSLGYDFDKCFSLPIVDTYLQDRTNYQNEIYLPSYENEYIVLVIRLILKNALTPFLLLLPHQQYRFFKSIKSKGIVRDGGYREFLDLKSKINQEKLDKCLKENFSFLSKKTFFLCESVLEKNNSLISFFKIGRFLKKELKAYRDYGELTSFCKAFIRLYSIRFFAILRKLRIYDRIQGKKAEYGGRIIAFIGGDGAGKTTTISNLQNTLKKQFAVKTIHVGRPKTSNIGFLLTTCSKIASVIGQTDRSKALRLLAVAYNRKIAFQKACKLRDQGVIVLQDRIPLKGITAMDCPRIHHLKKGKYKFLSKLENKQYQTIKGVDMLFVMKLKPEIALQRRPEDNPEELLIRSGQIWDNLWVAPYANEINTGENNPEEVQNILLEKVWGDFNKSFIRLEVLGLNGTGKSTLFSEINKKIPNIAQNIDTKKYFFFSVLNILKFFIPSFRVYFLTRKIKYVKIYFRFHTSMSIIRKWNRCGKYPNKNLIYDQGPIFQLVFLLKEKCISKKQFFKYISEIKKSIPIVVFLEAPNEDLYERVRNRTGVKARGQYMEFEEFNDFCNTYKKGFDLVKEYYPSYFEIDTKYNSVEEVLETFINKVNEK